MREKTTKRTFVWVAIALAFAVLLTAFVFATGSGTVRAAADTTAEEEGKLLYIVDAGRVNAQEGGKLGYGYDPTQMTPKYVDSTTTFIKRNGGTFGDITEDGGKTLTRLYNSYTDKPFSMNDSTGKKWGFNDNYSTDMPHRLGRSEGAAGYSEFRSVNDADTSNERLIYKFEVESGDMLDVTVITHAPSDFGTVNGKMSVNGGAAFDLLADSIERTYPIGGCKGVLDRTDNKYYLTLTFGEEGAQTVVNGFIIKKPYGITYNLDGGVNNAANTATYTRGSGLTLADPTREGYAFAGWYDAATGGNRVTAISAEQTGHVTLYARWNETYRITYNLNGGTNNAANTATYVHSVGLTLADPTREGYAFAGWYETEEGGDKVTAISAERTGAVTLYARWNEIYSITYNLNGGTNNAANAAEYTHGVGLTLAEPTRTGYAFDGWYETEEGGDKVTAISAERTGEVTLYARWRIATYAITYNLDNGTNNAANTATYTYGVGLTLADPTREGYAFVGWYDAASGGNKITAITDTQTGNVTLYARWRVATYAVTYHLDGGTNNAANAAEYTRGVGLTLADPTREGYTFDGWYDAEEGGNKVTAISTTQTGDVTLYARWTKNSTDDGKKGGCNSSLGGTTSLCFGLLLLSAGVVVMRKRKAKN